MPVLDQLSYRCSEPTSAKCTGVGVRAIDELLFRELWRNFGKLKLNGGVEIAGERKCKVSGAGIAEILNFG
jgi:hypothetical protein